MVASGQDTDSDVDEAWETREEPASEHSNSAGENSDASSTNESNNERSLALSSNEVEERDLFSMAAEEGSDIKKAKEYDESELEDAAVKIQKVHRGRNVRKVSRQAKRTKQEKRLGRKDMEAQEAEGRRNKHIKNSPREKERKILLCTLSATKALRGICNLSPILMFQSCAKIRRDRKVIQRLPWSHLLHTATRY